MTIDTNLVEELRKSSSILMISLHGIRTSLENELGIKNVLISSDDTIKADLARKLDKNGTIDYPYAYLNLTDIAGVRDQNNNKAIQRWGIYPGKAGATRNTSRKGYMFPVKLGAELKYVDSDPARALTMAEAMVILSLTGGLVFSMDLSGISIEVRVEIPESITIPLAEVGNVASPGALEIALPLILHTYVGVFRDIAAVTGDRPTTELQIKLDGEPFLVNSL